MPWFAGTGPTNRPQSYAQVIKAEIIQSGDLGLQRTVMIGAHGMKSQAAIR